MFEKMDLILPDAAFDGPMQMALDEVLLRKVMHPTLRFYEWAGECVTFGYFQKLEEVRSTHQDRVLVRRRTGGGIVEHGSDLTFSLIIPRGCDVAAFPPAIFYNKLHHAFANFLIRLGNRDVRLAGTEESLPGPSCFSAPVPDDLLCAGKKILGGAQCRSAGALLYQGSLQGMSGIGKKIPFAQAFAETLSSQVARCILPCSVIEEAEGLAQSRYGSTAWIERR